ncbi:MAG TPA: pilin [Candidatus Paceibacterota bacterium]
MKVFLITILLLNLCSFSTVFAQAQQKPVILEPLPGITDSSSNFNFPTLVQGLFKLSLGAGAILAVLMLVLGGIEYMVSEAINKKKLGLERIRNSVLGLFLLFGSVLILQTINPDILSFKVLEKATVQSSQERVRLNFSVEEGVRTGTTDTSAVHGQVKGVVDYEGAFGSESEAKARTRQNDLIAACKASGGKVPATSFDTKKGSFSVTCRK